MESLIKKLQEEAGLSESQAIKAIHVIKTYMDSHDSNIDWDKFFKGKFQDFRSMYKSVTEKLVDKVDNLTTQAKDLSNKASNIFKEDEER